MSVQVESAAAPVAQAAPASPTKPKLEGDALLDALRTQLDFYFSKSNLATDAFLLSQLSAHPKTGVPVDVICSFRKILALTDNKDTVRAAMKQCQNLVLDTAADSVRSNIKHERTTLILRDISPDADAKALRAVFETRPAGVATPAAGHLLSLNPDINDTWFVHFDSEAAATDTCMDVQSHAFTDKAYMFNGKPIAARLKNESLNRGFYTGPPVNAPPAATHSGSSLLVGGPVSPQGQMPPVYSSYNPYTQAPYGYGHPQYMGYGYNMPMVAPQQMQQQQGGAAAAQSQPQAPLNKAQVKAANVAAQAAATQASKEKKAAKALKAQQAGAVASPTSAAAGAASPANAAADGKKKKAKGGKAADGAPVVQGVGAAPVSAPLVTSAVNPYGHEVRAYTREQMAAIVDAFISTARANSQSAAAKRPAGFAQCHDPEKAVLKEKPSTTFSILEPFPVIYPASPSPLLAAQPHHSTALPFLELGAPMDGPYFPADAGSYQQQQNAAAAGARRKSQSGAPGKKPAAAAAGSNGNFTASAAAQAGAKAAQPQQARPASAQAQSGKSAAPQPKIVAPPAVQPSATGAAPAKPQSFAAAALAAANQPQQPKIVPPKPVQPKAAAAATTQAAPAAQANKAGKKKGPAATAAGASPTPAAASTPAQPAAPKQPVVNYASRVGAVSPAEAAAKAASIKQAKEEAAKKERAEAEAKNPSAAPAADQATPAPAEKAADKKAADKSAAPSSTKPTTAAAAPAATASPPAAEKAAFSYAAMIKKAPAAGAAAPAGATPSPPAKKEAQASAPAAAATASPSTPAASKDAAAAGATVAAGAPKSEAGNWRSQ